MSLIGEIRERVVRRDGSGDHPDQENGRGSDHLPGGNWKSRSANLHSENDTLNDGDLRISAGRVFNVLVASTPARGWISRGSLVAILDADNEGSYGRPSLIQTLGLAARCGGR
jgi:hypothetical protein